MDMKARDTILTGMLVIINSLVINTISLSNIYLTYAMLLMSILIVIALWHHPRDKKIGFRQNKGENRSIGIYKWMVIPLIMIILLLYISIFLNPFLLSDPRINIESPKNNEGIARMLNVTGEFSGKLPAGWHAWLVSSYKDLPNLYQPLVEIPNLDFWKVKVWVGGPDEASHKYEIAVILVNDEWDEYFRYWQSCAVNNKWYTSVPLPNNFPVKDRVDVIRV